MVELQCVTAFAPDADSELYGKLLWITAGEEGRTKGVDILKPDHDGKSAEVLLKERKEFCPNLATYESRGERITAPIDTRRAHGFFQRCEVRQPRLVSQSDRSLFTHDERVDPVPQL